MSAVTITAGKTWGSNDPVSVANLNLSANPTAEIPPASITSAELDIEEVSGALTVNSARNLFRNAGFSKLATAHALSSGNRVAAPAQGWFWRHTGTASVTLTHDLTTLLPDGPQASLVFTGASGTSTAGTVVGQSFGAEDIRDIRGGDLTVSFYIKNNTGAAVTPYLQVFGWDAAATAAAVTQLESVAMTSVAANNTWTRVSCTVDASLWSGGSALNGVDFFLYTDAAMTNASYTLSYSRPQLELGATATTWEPALFRPIGKKIHRSSTAPSSSFGVRQGYLQGDQWSVANSAVWECLDSSNAAAVWVPVVAQNSVIQMRAAIYDVTAAQGLTTSYADVDGSSIAFTPLSAASTIVYRLTFLVANSGALEYVIGHFKLLLEGADQTESTMTIGLGPTSPSGASTFNQHQLVTFEFALASWGVTPGTLKLQGREFNANTSIKLHATFQHDGATATVLFRPTLTVTEIL
jgi:hypothetical protein